MILLLKIAKRNGGRKIARYRTQIYSSGTAYQKDDIVPV